MADEKAPDNNDKGSEKADEKTGGEQKIGAPEKYDLKLPDGSLLEAGDIERIATYAKERGLSQDAAAELLKRESAAVSVHAERERTKLKEQAKEWVGLAQSDKEIGGDKFQANVEVAKQALKEFGSEALLNTLKETGLGDHPEVIRLFYRIGKKMQNDTTILTGGQPAGTGKKDLAELLYGGKS